MKFAILSDIHANADALEVVLDKCATLKVDRYISLGDIVGYNAEPARCIEMLQKLPVVAKVRGNHDEYATLNDDEEILGFNPHARQAVLWTRDQLNDDHRLFLIKDVPYRTTVPMIMSTIVHATLDSPESWGYVFDAHHARDNFAYQFTPVCFCGHSHVPIAFRKVPFSPPGSNPVEEILDWVDPIEDGMPIADFEEPEEMTVEIRTGNKYLFNVGSVGQPRNRDPRSSFAVYDTENQTVSRFLLPYDIIAAQQKVLEAGLPERLARRLGAGI